MDLPDELSANNNDPARNTSIETSGTIIQNGASPVEYNIKRTYPLDRNVKSFDFVVGGALPPDSPAYVKRPADDELFNSVLAGQCCYSFAPHGMGKSSLIVYSERRLQQQGFCTATVDFSGLTPNVEVAQLYLFLLSRLTFQLELSQNPELWWTEQASLDVTHRFINFLQDVVLAEIQDPVIIFVDGINSSLNPEFLESFFAALGAIYNARAADTPDNRLNFVLFGVANPHALTKDSNRFLLSVAKKIELLDFSCQEAHVLQQALQVVAAEQGEAIFARIFYWTGGHPYLTQKLCSTVANMWDRHWNDERVDGLIERLFRSSAVYNEPNLQFVHDDVSTNPRRRKLLPLYRQVYKQKQVPYDEQSLDQNWLRMVGLVRAEDGFLQIRNEIYRSVFNLDWIKANSPFNWIRVVTIILVLLILLAAGGISFTLQQRQERMNQAQTLIDKIRSDTSSDKRLTDLAELFKLPGFEDQARGYFYNELDPASQRALFEVADPQAVGNQLITVIKGLYTDPNLVDNEQNDALLDSMAQPLSQLKASPALGSFELELEITQWRKGREYYRTPGEYQRAVDAFDIAIKMNDRNPGTYFDRGLANTALGNLSQALDDFMTVLQLDESWQPQVQQAIQKNHQLYNAMWNEEESYQQLVALLPTPTFTPTPTNTPTPTVTSTPTRTATPTSTSTPINTSTPLPTHTPTPAPATATPATTATSIRASSPTTDTPTSVATASSSGVPTGAFTLLAPLSPKDPSNGPVTFEWQWSGPVPPDYGFEVRVWREGMPPVGAHNAVLDNLNGSIKSLGDNTYQLETNIIDAYGVQGHSGEYLWTVALVRISPDYADLGLQAPPDRLLFAAPGGGGGGGKDGGGGGGGVGIQ